jgi:HEAT repeat protein
MDLTMENRDPSFERDLDELSAAGARVGSLHALSDLTRQQKARTRLWWATLPIGRRRELAARMVELAENNVDLDFTRVFEIALDDDDPPVRASAIEGLWENEGMPLLRRLLEIDRGDQSEEVRLATLRSLGRFALLAVRGEIAEEWSEPIRSALLASASDPAAPLSIRRRAIEAIAVYPEDAAVHDLIERAHGHPNTAMRASALYAMGLNLDLRWLDAIIADMASPEAILRFEAARASGELGSQRAVPGLLELLNDPDREAQLAAVAALGKLGGKAAGTALRRLLQSDDEVLRDAAEEALDELTFGADPLSVGR